MLEVAITIDTEFSIAGRFKDENNSPVSGPMVEGRIGQKENGLGFLLDTMRRYGLKATFFVEAVNTRYFGFGEMGRFVHRIVEDGQDVQLHVHPEWAVFEGGVPQARHPVFPLNGSLAGRTRAQVFSVLDIAYAAFETWGLGAPRAIRTGSLLADVDLYSHLYAYGIRLSSNLGNAIVGDYPDRLQINGGRQWVNGVLEVPVTCFYDLPALSEKHLRPMQVTACSWREMRSVLETARRDGVRTIVIITHPFEYFKRADDKCSKITPNRINQSRFVKLCGFLASRREDYKVVTFGGCADRWLDEGEAPDIPLRASTALPALGRAVTNKLNDSVWKL